VADAGEPLEIRLAGEWDRVRRESAAEIARLQEELRAAARRAAAREAQLEALARKLERDGEPRERPSLRRPRREAAPSGDVPSAPTPDPGRDSIRAELEEARAELARREATHAELEERARELDRRAADLDVRRAELDRLQYALAAQREQLAALAQRLDRPQERPRSLAPDGRGVPFADGLRSMARRAARQVPPAPD
jgi:DNA repair exonuclease SbcCD ATPase subunit